MNPETVRLVQASWQRLKPNADTAAALLYQRLFAIRPQARHLFQEDLTRQGLALMAMLDAAVVALEDLEPILPAVRELGARHAGYGVRARDYQRFGEALLWTLEQVLGRDFSAAERAAWARAYRVLVEEMQAGAAGQPGKPS